MTKALARTPITEQLTRTATAAMHILKSRATVEQPMIMLSLPPIPCVALAVAVQIAVQMTTQMTKMLPTAAA